MDITLNSQLNLHGRKDLRLQPNISMEENRLNIQHLIQAVLKWTAEWNTYGESSLLRTPGFDSTQTGTQVFFGPHLDVQDWPTNYRDHMLWIQKANKLPKAVVLESSLTAWHINISGRINDFHIQGLGFFVLFCLFVWCFSSSFITGYFGRTLYLTPEAA